MQRSRAPRPVYLAAFSELIQRIAEPLRELPKRSLPIKMYVAGGAAMHFYTGERISNDVDAVFSKRIALPSDLEVTYQDPDGAARLLYFDRQYNDTFALLHEDAHADSVPLTLKEIDASILDVRLLSAPGSQPAIQIQIRPRLGEILKIASPFTAQLSRKRLERRLGRGR